MKYLVKAAVVSLFFGTAVVPSLGRTANIVDNDVHYDMQTVREVTSMYKLAQVCLAELEFENDIEEMVNQQICTCVIYELGDLLSYREYKAVEIEILYERDWKETDAMQRSIPHLKKACEWKG